MPKRCQDYRFDNAFPFLSAVSATDWSLHNLRLKALAVLWSMNRFEARGGRCYFARPSFSDAMPLSGMLVAGFGRPNFRM
jgi:hypothetical protein